MVNVANGNLLVQSSDVDVPERGIDLAFQRTYNSQSWHDASNSDGSGQDVFGNGWTSTFDEHIAYGSTHNVISVYDLDGARYDYTSNGSGGWTAPPGMAGTTLTLATTAQYSGNTCYYQWTKKNGTAYIFARPDYAAQGCGGAGYNGRIAEIFARNSNNWVRFDYSWVNGDTSSSNNITQINVVHADGQHLTLAFATFGGHDELHTLTRNADGQSVSYWYDNSGNLTDVCEIGNGSSNTVSSPCAAGQIHHQYAYNANGYQMAWVNSSNWVMTNYNCGTYQSYGYDGAGRAVSIANNGTRNPYIADASSGTTTMGCQGTGSVLQPSYTVDYGGQQTQYYVETLSYASGQTTLTDTDGHKSSWTFDSVGRVTQLQQWPNPNASFDLSTQAFWDTDGLHNNNLDETVDPRGYATDYAYDASGNTIAVALPSVSTNVGTFRPTSLYSYDSHNNLLSYCDPVKVGSTGYDWTNRPQSDSLCVVGMGTTGATQYVWNTSDTSEIDGYLTDTYTPLGYHRHFSYDTNSQAGIDAGLPTMIQGDSITQTDGTVRQPTQTFSYDGNGNVTGYNKGNGAWTISYDSLNRSLITTDPDNVSSYICYDLNGQTQYTETASQHAADGAPAQCQLSSPASAVAYTYDSDGNEITEVHHYNGTAGTTIKWYDGDDRLVEVQQPQDPNGNDYYSYPWMTRYIYDISQGQNVSVDGASFRAYGNLYKTQEYIPSNPIVQSGSAPASPQWSDVRGTSFDALDRTLGSYENAFGPTPKVTNSYDATGYYGLLSQTQDAVGEQGVLTYYATGWLQQKQYQNDGGLTPWLTYTYDPDGHATTINSTQFGAENHKYDADNNLTTVAEPQGGNYVSPATITYGYYGDGKRMTLSVSSASFSQSNLFQYAYRADGALEKQQVNGATAGAFAWTYTNAGRELTQSDPYTGNVINLLDTNDVGTGATRTLQAKTYTYDAYGRVNSLVLPEGYTYNSFTYDAEDETTGYARGNAYCSKNGTITTTCAGPRGQVYTVRAELTKVSDNNPLAAAGSGPSANGTIVQNTLTQFDARSGMVIGMNAVNYGSSTTPGGSLVYGHDAAGRQTTVNGTFKDSTGSWNASVTRAYDAENHVASQTYSGSIFPCPESLTMCNDWQIPGINYPSIDSGFKLTYGWGPNGHPIYSDTSDPSTGSNVVRGFHWDGDDLLFESGGVVYVGKLAMTNESSSTGITVIDRDMTGQQVATHMPTDFSAWSSAPAGRTTQPGSKDATDTLVSGAINSDNDQYAPAEPALAAGRTDGYDDGYGNTFQGVRAYDENTSQWTAPDAYAGEVHDPMSQKPFMWNRNNPIAYADPTGYISVGDVWNAVAGDDINTLRSADASVGSKVIAVADLATTVAAPEKGALESLGKVVLKVLAKDAADHAATAGMSALLKADLAGSKAIIGAGTEQTLRDAERLASQYGGEAKDWAKMQTTSQTLADGSRIVIHFYENLKTGQKVEFKSIIRKAVR